MKIAAGRVLKRTMLLALLLALALGLGYGAMGMRESRTPFVDFSERQPSTEPGPSVNGDRLRFAVATMWSVESTFSMYHQLVKRICEDVGYRDTFVLRPSYGALLRAMEQGQVDVAFVCTGPYIRARPKFKLLVRPEFEDGLEYFSALIVPASSPAKTLDDLRGATIGFSDPESFTGCIVPCVELADRGLHPKSFFKKVVFTGSHERSIQAVDRGIVDAAAVHSIVWASARREEPSLAEDVKMIWSSDAYGRPPVIVPASVPAPLEIRLKEAFLKLGGDAEGKRILSAIGIARFVRAYEEDYQTAVAVCERFTRYPEVTSWLAAVGH